jgi:hypothetical protein
MKVTGETFSLIKKKESRRGKILKVSKLSGKRTVIGQNSGELLWKHRRGNSYFLGITHTEFTKKNYILIS